MVGSQSVVGSNVQYFRYLILEASNLNSYKISKEIVPIWKTTITSRGSSDDLRLVFPYLVTAAELYIGENT